MKLSRIAEVIKDLHNIDIFENTRRREVIEMRAVANTYMRNHNKMRLKEIVQAYAENNFSTAHCTIIYSLNNYENHTKYNKKLDKKMIF